MKPYYVFPLLVLLYSCNNQSPDTISHTKPPLTEQGTAIDVPHLFDSLDVFAFLSRRDYGMNEDTIAAILNFSGTPDTILPLAYFLYAKKKYYMGEWEYCLAYFREAEWQYLHQFDESHPQVANLYAWWAMPYFKMDKCDSLNMLASKAITLLERYPKNDQPLIAAAAHNSMGHYYRCVEDYANMQAAHQKAYALLGTEQFREVEAKAFTLLDLGTSYIYQQDYWTAIDAYEAALPRLEYYYSNIIGEGLTATVYNDLGYCYNAVGEYDRAIHYLRKAIDKNLTYATLENCHPGVAANYKNIAAAYSAIGDPVRAALQFTTALQILERQHPDKTVRAARIRIGLIEALYKQGKLAEALAIVEQALAYEMDANREYHTQTVVPLHQWQGRIFMAQGKERLMRASFTKAENILRQHHPDDLLLLFDHYLEEAKTFADSEGFDQALDRLLSLAEMTRGKDYFRQKEVWLQIGRAYLQLDQPAEAKPWLDAVQRATDRQKATSGSTSQYDLEFLSAHFSAQALWHEKQFGINGKQVNRDSAIAYLEEALNYLYRQRAVLHNNDFVLTTFRPMQERLIRLYKKDGAHKRQEELFHLFEQSKAIRLVQVAKDARSRVFRHVPVAVSNQIADAEARINYYTTQLHTGAKEQEAFYSAQLEFSLAAWEQLKARIRQQYPGYYDFRFNHQTIPVATLQRKLLPGQSVLSFFWGQEEVQAMLITGQDFDLQTIGRSAEVEAHIQKLLQGIDGARQGTATANRAMQQYISSATTLYHQLIRPFETAISSEALSRLVIIPDGPIANIPFNALLTEDPGSEIRKTYNFPYLIHRYLLSLGHSATFLFNDYPTQTPAIQSLPYAGFAPFAAVAKTEVENASTRERSSLDGLPFSGEEVAKGQAIFGGETYLRRQANRENFLTSIAQARVLHCATHAVGNTANGEWSYLLLSDPDNDRKSEAIYAAEIFNLEMQADLAVLGACQSASGSFQPGEGVYSLAYAFSAAGANSVCATYWNLNDEAGYQILSNFFAQLKSGSAKDEALRLAQIQYLQQRRDQRAQPYYWAVFHLYGNTEALAF